jgi:hypothetical protein
MSLTYACLIYRVKANFVLTDNVDSDKLGYEAWMLE